MSLVAIQALTAELQNQQIELTKKDAEIKKINVDYAILKKEKDAEISELKDRLERIEALLLDQK